jgi:hypothetical protein
MTAAGTGVDGVRTYECAPGYLCGEGSDEATGTEDCPAHHFCPGNNVATQCPDGQYSNVGGLTKTEECIPCPAGNYCTPLDIAGGITEVTWTACPEHYYCGDGLFDADPTDAAGVIDGSTPCPAGSYCPEGSPAPMLCPPGTFSAAGTSNPCDACTAGD